MSEPGRAWLRRPAGWLRDPNVPWLLSIVVAMLVVFWPATIGGRYFIIGDAWSESFPLRSLAWEAVKRGDFPGWTTALFSGYPLFAMAQLGLAYPLTWGHAFDPLWGEQIYVLAPFVLAPAFTYAYARTLGRSRAASLLAGFTFGYGGLVASPISHNGMFSNSYIWLPLVLTFMERAQLRPFIPCLLFAALAYAMGVLAGVGQGFLFAGIIVLIYGLFSTAALNRDVPWSAWQRFRAAAVGAGAVVLGAGLGAFQIVETRRTHQVSIRSELSYSLFSEGSHTFREIAASMLSPLWSRIADVTSFVAPIALLLSIVAIVTSVRAWRSTDPRVLFWAGVCALSWVLMAGSHTPLHRLLFQIPVVNQFRVPARHTAEWTFAVAILASYGFDWLAARLQSRPPSRTLSRWVAAIAGLALATTVSVWWLNTMNANAQTGHLTAKLVITLGLTVSLVASLSLPDVRGKGALLAAVSVVGCLTEPYVCLREVWFPFTKTEERLTATTSTTRRLQKLVEPQPQRVYSYVYPFADERKRSSRLDAPNRTALFGLHEAGGYEPLIPARYSAALGNVTLFAMTFDRAAHAGPGDAFHPGSHTIDLLNVGYVVRDLRHNEPALPTAWLRSPAGDRVVLDLGVAATRAHLVQGWSGDQQTRDGNGVWSDGRLSRLRVELKPTATDYELSLLASPFAPATPFQLTAVVNGRPLEARAILPGNQQLNWRVPSGLLFRGMNQVDFKYSRTAAPARTIPGSADQRQLAIFADQIALTPAP